MMANSMEHKNEVNISVQNGSDPIQLLLHNLAPKIVSEGTIPLSTSGIKCCKPSSCTTNPISQITVACKSEGQID